MLLGLHGTASALEHQLNFGTSLLTYNSSNNPTPDRENNPIVYQAITSYIHGKGLVLPLCYSPKPLPLLHRYRTLYFQKHISYKPSLKFQHSRQPVTVLQRRKKHPFKQQMGIGA